MTDGEWCWISADGHLESGSESDLFRAHAAGRLPNDNPIWCPSQNAWRTMHDLLAGQKPAVDPDDAATLRRPAVTPAQADELVPSTRRELPWFDALELPTEKLPASAPGPELRLAPTPVVTSLRPVARTVPPAASRGLPMLIGGGVAVAGALFAFVLVTSALFAERPAPSAIARGERAVASRTTTAALRARPPSASACKSAVTPLRVAPFVVPSSPLSVASFGSSIAVGAVTGMRTGVGLVLDASDLSVHDTQWLADNHHLSAVVPASDDAFIADRWTASVPGTTAFTVGMTPKGFSRVGSDATQHTIWPGDPREPITRPVLVRAGESGWAVAFRRGDGAGSVRVGWLDESGNPRGSLGSYATDAERASAPSIAIDGQTLAVAFSERSAGGSWQVRLGHAPLGKLPSAFGRFGSDAQSPALAALGGGRWLLVYVEGAERDSRVLRAQLLDAQLGPLGRPQTLSDSPSSTPSVAIWAEGKRAAVVFTRDRGRERGELWATALDCE